MPNNTNKSESKLMQESHEIFERKREASQHMNMVAKETAKAQHIEKPILIRTKDYLHYRGMGWLSGDPLAKDPEEKFPDRVSPTFRKLLQITEDLAAVGRLEMLDVYLDALRKHGIDIKIDPSDVRVQDIDETWQAIENMSGFQTTICECNDEIVDIKAVEAEDINFTPKNEFKKVLTFYDKKKRNKDIDDEYQDWVAHLELVETSVNKVYDESLN
jgi:hypothetical protein